MAATDYHPNPHDSASDDRLGEQITLLTGQSGPDCWQSRHVDAPHIQHWAHGLHSGCTLMRTPIQEQAGR